MGTTYGIITALTISAITCLFCNIIRGINKDVSDDKVFIFSGSVTCVAILAYLYIETGKVLWLAVCLTPLLIALIIVPFYLNKLIRKITPSRFASRFASYFVSLAIWLTPLCSWTAATIDYAQKGNWGREPKKGYVLPATIDTVKDIGFNIQEIIGL